MWFHGIIARQETGPRTKGAETPRASETTPAAGARAQIEEGATVIDQDGAGIQARATA